MTEAVAGFVPDPELFPFRSRWLHSTAGRVHYLDEGDGVPILLLHGNPTWSFLYRHLIPLLRDRFRCVAVDYPGFGLSDRPAGYGYTPAEHARVVGELVDQLRLDGLIVMGHDWGGPIGLSVAAARPARVRGLVLGSTWFWPAGARLRLFAAVMSSRPMRWAILRHNVFVERILPYGVARELSEAELAHYRGVQPTPQARVAVAEFPRQIVAATDWLSQLHAAVIHHLADTPTLVTWPMRDRGFPARRVLPRVRAALRDIEVVRLPGAGHYFLEDASDIVAAAIRARFW